MMKRAISAALLSITIVIADAQQVRLDSETHRELLLNGRPQIGLWKALLKEAEIKAASAEMYVDVSFSVHD